MNSVLRKEVHQVRVYDVVGLRGPHEVEVVELVPRHPHVQLQVGQLASQRGNVLGSG